MRLYKIFGGGNTVIKKVLLCALLAALYVSAAFGGATEDLLYEAKGTQTTPQRIQTLIKFGTDINANDNDGRTALMWAAEYNDNPEIIKRLEGL